MKTRSARSRVCTLIAALSLIGMTAVTGCASKQVTGLSTLTPDGSVPIRTEIKDFILGPGDELSISVWRFNDLNQVALVSKGGDIQMLPVGEVHVAGLNAYQVRDVLAERLSDYIVNPQVSVSVKSLKSQKIFVLGEVY
ncbi:MAG TPA: polysaccharide biosynthesis/export family protein, partial [Candidatus Acidoferrum sp.]|nr:polysaccharide biosynthesis/export family protein [Candidatus Acidoferrum sp.]